MASQPGPEQPQDKGSDIPDNLEALLSEAPPEVRKQVGRMVQMTGMSFTGPVPNPLTQKMTPEHIGKIIEYTEADSQRDDRQLTSSRRYAFAAFCVALAFIGILLVIFVLNDERDLALQVLALAGAFGGGFGTAKWLAK